MKIKKLIAVRGKGTKNERRVLTNVTLYWSETLRRWVTIPE